MTKFWGSRPVGGHGSRVPAISISRALRRSYDRSADQYDEQFRELQQVKYRAMLGERGERLGTWLDRGRVLDLGCGTGLLGEFATEYGHDCRRLVGIDFSIAAARRAGARSRAVAQAAMQQLPFGNGSFGVVVAFTSFGLLPSAASDARSLAELARVLSPDGAFVITVLAENAEAFRSRFEAAGLRAEPGVRCGQDVGYVGARESA